MKTRSLAISLIAFVVLVASLLGLNVALGNTPVLGLDLRGGLSVIYRTTEPATEDDLVGVRDLMRGQLEDFGIAEPDVRVEGENIVVDLPGVSDRNAAFEALDVSGIVELRPVYGCQAVAPITSVAPTGSTVPTDGSTAPTSTAPSSTSVAPGTTAVPSTTVGAVDEESSGAGHRRGFAAAPPTTEVVTPGTTDGTIAPETPTTAVPADGSTPPSGTDAPTSPADGTVPLDAGQQELLAYPSAQQQCLVGPSGGTGEVFSRGSAAANLNQQNGSWLVDVDLNTGGSPSGEDVWNTIASQCFNGVGACPSRQLAIVLDDEIQSAPTVNAPSFAGTVQITGAFDESEARSLERTLNRGAFPVQVERERVESVSPTAGQDSLNAALIAGLIGIGAMLLAMVAYYRKLSIVVIGGLLVWGMTVFTLASFVSQATNYALTLAGATGIIVAVGVTIDSYVVFFERLRDEMRSGRTLANAGPRSFAATWRTILSADMVTLLGSLILFWLSVGSVKGFALYLGLTTICDLLVCYFFTRPAVFLLGRSRWYSNRPAKAATGAAT